MRQSALCAEGSSWTGLESGCARLNNARNDRSNDTGRSSCGNDDGSVSGGMSGNSSISNCGIISSKSSCSTNTGSGGRGNSSPGSISSSRWDENRNGGVGG